MNQETQRIITTGNMETAESSLSDNEEPPNEAFLLLLLILIVGGTTFLINAIVWSLLW